MPRLSNVKIIFLSIICLSAQIPALAGDFLEDGKRFYAEGQYDRAGRCFAAKLVADPENATAHYLLGNVYVDLKRASDAIKEYQKAAELDEGGQVTEYSQQALSRLVPPLSQAPAAAAVSGVVDGRSAAPVSANGDAALKRKSAMAISRQADENAKHASAECDALIAKLKSDGDAQVKNLEKEMNARIQDNGRPAYYRGVKIFDPAEDNKAIREEYNPKIERIRQDVQRRSDEALSNYKMRSAAMEDSAIMLDKEYLTPGKSVKLSPTGRSDIYVRNFETVDEASGSPVPVYAAPAKSLSAAAAPKHNKPAK